MGSRGMKSGLDQRQMTIERMQLIEDVALIKDKVSLIMESSDFSFGRGGISTTEHRFCACCEEYIIPIDIVNAECPICGWIDDDFQNKRPNSLRGKNNVSLNDSRKSYFGRILG